jgi:hypothetical protein
MFSDNVHLLCFFTVVFMFWSNITVIVSLSLWGVKILYLIDWVDLFKLVI